MTDQNFIFTTNGDPTIFKVVIRDDLQP